MEEPKFTLDTGPSFTAGSGQAFSLTDAPVTPDPLTADTVAVEVEQELSAVLQGFQDRSRRENQRFVEATDSEFWFAVCFQTRQQKEEFLQKMGWTELGDKYLDGLLVADAAGIELEAHTPALPKLKTDPKLDRIALPL